MKALVKILLISIIINCGIGSVATKATAQTVSVSFQVFYDELSPYGAWIDDAVYGYVWIPNVATGFIPYSTYGYWAYTDFGWTWISFYPWGWAPFHYGRWYFDPVYGAVWVPGVEWGPGWVTWRFSGGYYGWAPIGPGISLSFAYSTAYNMPHHHWTFVKNSDFGRRNITNYYAKRTSNIGLLGNSNVIYNPREDATRSVSYNAGPSRSEVEKYRGRITPISVKENSKPGQQLGKGRLHIYKPVVKENSFFEKKPAPARVTNANELKSRERGVSPETKQSPRLQPLKQKTARPEQSKPKKVEREVVPSPKMEREKQQRAPQPIRQQPIEREAPARNREKQEKIQRSRPVQSPPMKRNQEPSQPIKQQPVQPRKPVQTQPPQNQQRQMNPPQKKQMEQYNKPVIKPPQQSPPSQQQRKQTPSQRGKGQ